MAVRCTGGSLHYAAKRKPHFTCPYLTLSVRTLTDARLRHANEQYITRNSRDANFYAILMRVKVIKNETMTPDFNSPGSVLYQWPRA